MRIGEYGFDLERGHIESLRGFTRWSMCNATTTAVH